MNLKWPVQQVGELFRKHKCGVIMLTQSKCIYDIPSGQFLFWYPDKDLLELKRVVGKNKNNMPIIGHNQTSWKVSNLGELEEALNSLDQIVNN